ncbi:hypothetical protein [Chlorobium sp.]|nr:hypothetical protein [Chlorobium sp.]
MLHWFNDFLHALVALALITASLMVVWEQKLVTSSEKRETE